MTRGSRGGSRSPPPRSSTNVFYYSKFDDILSQIFFQLNYYFDDIIFTFMNYQKIYQVVVFPLLFFIH